MNEIEPSDLIDLKKTLEHIHDRLSVAIDCCGSINSYYTKEEMVIEQLRDIRVSVYFSIDRLDTLLGEPKDD